MWLGTVRRGPRQARGDPKAAEKAAAAAGVGDRERRSSHPFRTKRGRPRGRARRALSPASPCAPGRGRWVALGAASTPRLPGSGCPRLRRAPPPQLTPPPRRRQQAAGRSTEKGRRGAASPPAAHRPRLRAGPLAAARHRHTFSVCWGATRGETPSRPVARSRGARMFPGRS